MEDPGDQVSYMRNLIPAQRHKTIQMNVLGSLSSTNIGILLICLVSVWLFNLLFVTLMGKFKKKIFHKLSTTIISELRVCLPS